MKSSTLLTAIFTLLLVLTCLEAQAEIQPLKPFKAYYKSKIRVGWFKIKVNSTRELKQVSNGNWKLDFTAEASFAKVKENSLMSFKDGHYQPIAYRYRATGLADEKDQTLNFKADKKQVEDLENNQVFSTWHQHIQDNVSYMLQASLDLTNNKSELIYPVFERRSIKDFKFKIVGEETLKTDFKSLKTIKIQLLGNKDARVYAWLATEYQYLLVRLEEISDGKTRYNMELTKLEMSAH